MIMFYKIMRFFSFCHVEYLLCCVIMILQCVNLLIHLMHIVFF
jgi:hypothetical protein